jgi:hypothetical protein
MLYGLSISAFRNFDSDEQWLAPLQRVNVIIGSNNSGKSNVLRYMKRIVGPAFDPRRTSGVEQAPVDVPREGSRVSSIAYWAPFKPLNLFAAWQPSWTQTFRELGFLDETGEFIQLRVTTAAVDRGRRYAGDVPNVNHQTQMMFHAIWSNLTGSSGGGFNEHWFPVTMNRLVENTLAPIETHYIPSFRQIPSRMPEFHDEYAQANGDDHIIDRLADLA